MNMCLNLNLLPHELIVDNFAGGGGTSTGLEKAFGRPVDIAINHDPKAIAMHRANHPNTRHFCEDVWDVDPVKVTNNQPVGLVWLSPDCKHFSKAKGGKPVEKKIRGLAWIALRWADLARPRIIMLENVEEFKTWGRLGKDGFPSKDCKTKLNPVHWIVKYLRQLNHVTDRNNRMLAEVRVIQSKLEKKNKFMCTKCHEVNEIDFKKLPSQAAITRGMSLIEQEFDGMKVELN